MADPRVASSPVNTILSGLMDGRGAGPSIAYEGVLVERRAAPALERGNARFNHHYMLSWERSPVVTEQAYNGRRPTRATKLPGTLSLGLAGELTPVRFHAPFQVVACLINPISLQTMIEEQDRPSRAPLQSHLLSEDEALTTLIRLLVAESDPDGNSGRLYGDSLALAIMTRFVANAQKLPVKSMETVRHPLPPARLQRVVDLMTSDLSGDLSLDVLAAESGYSRAHFLRMFQAATGSTPHRYLRERRLDHARDLLMSGRRSITEIAYSAGFSSHSHLTKLFHERFGATPSEFRRQLKGF